MHPNVKLSGTNEPGLPAYDIARVNLEQAVGLPGTEHLNIPQCLRWIDEVAEVVKAKTDRHFYHFRTNPERFSNSEAVFRMTWLATVLYKDFNLRYRMEVIPLDDTAFFRDPANSFIHGIIEGKGGTCATMPPLWAAVGRRLGYPLKLAGTRNHLFLRWEGADGERFNMETTSGGFVSHPDEYYLNWTVVTPVEDIKRYRLLESFTVEREIESFLSRRGRVLTENGRHGEAVGSYIQGFRRSPHEGILMSLRNAVILWGRHLLGSMGGRVPSLQICNRPRVHPEMPLDYVNQFTYLEALEIVLRDPVKREQWWEPLRRNPQQPPPGLPKMIRVTYPSVPGGLMKFEAIRDV